MIETSPRGQSTATQSPSPIKISARKSKKPLTRISQGDIFKDIEILECVRIEFSEIKISKISFPYTVLLNQECDLENDFNNSENKDTGLIHLAIAPAFEFAQYLDGNHWGGIFKDNASQKRTSSTIKKIMDNEIPRYHYLKFPDPDMPELILDFKHFFTINKKEIYSQFTKRLCSVDDLFKEKISQRFSFYISRIGLPE